MQKVLVTGVAGFIASQVAHSLLEQGIEVIGVDNINDYYDVRLKHHRLQQLQKKRGFHFIPMDVEDLPAIQKLFKEHRFEVVYNLAARAGVRGSVENPYVYLSTNTLGALNILEQIKSGDTKFILASTSSLYAGETLPFPETLPVNRPISPYAATKKAAEVMSYSYHHLYGIDVSIVRYFTVYGPAGRPDMSIFRFIQWIDKGERIELFGNGKQTRDFTFVSDIAQGTILASKKLGYEIINLGGGQTPVSINKVISMIEQSLGKKAIIEYKSFHKADLMETSADINKARNLLGWKPQVSFEEGLQKTIQWYLDHHELTRSIKL